MIHSLKPTQYWPTAPRSGIESRRVFRMKNMILRGTASEPYAEVYGGSLNLNEDIATSNLTGTVTTTTTSTEIVGSGTAFTTELRLGQFLEIFKPATSVRIPVVVDEIIDDTHFRACRLPETAVAGATVVRFPRLFELGKKRGTQLWGSAVEVDLGSIISVGDGTLRRNGAVLPGTSLTATRSPKLALFDAATGNFSVFTLGMATPATLTAAAIAGTGKNMQAGVYSVRSVPARIATRGYNNPSPKAEVTLTAGQRIQATVGAADTANGQDAWMFFVSLFLPGAGINGPWYRYELPNIFVRVGNGAGEIPAAGGTFNIEYNDAEVSQNDLLTFNNNPPPKAEFVVWMGGVPVYLSCQGPGETSPGPFIASGNPRNVEAVSPRQYVSTSPADTIVGGLVGVQGRLYLMCANSLQIAMATQQVDPRLPAFVVRPFWKSGFQNSESLISVGDNLVGMTTNGLARSISEGDEGSEEYGFATAVEELTRRFSPGHCLLKVDPKNNAIALFMSGYGLNDNDEYWTTRVLLYGLREQQWIGDVLLSSDTGDMIVCSAATINGRLEFLCGGRQADGTTVIRTYRWDDPSANEQVRWYIGWQWGDDGVENRPKAVKAIRPTAHFSTTGTIVVLPVNPGQEVDLLMMEGVGGLGPTFAPSVRVTQYDRVEVDFDNAMQWTVRAGGLWSGGVNTERDRIDEIVVETIIRGARR